MQCIRPKRERDRHTGRAANIDIDGFLLDRFGHQAQSQSWLLHDNRRDLVLLMRRDLKFDHEQKDTLRDHCCCNLGTARTSGGVSGRRWWGSPEVHRMQPVRRLRMRMIMH